MNSILDIITELNEKDDVPFEQNLIIDQNKSTFRDICLKHIANFYRYFYHVYLGEKFFSECPITHEKEVFRFVLELGYSSFGKSFMVILPKKNSFSIFNEDNQPIETNPDFLYDEERTDFNLLEAGIKTLVEATYNPDLYIKFLVTDRMQALASYLNCSTLDIHKIGDKKGIYTVDSQRFGVFTKEESFIKVIEEIQVPIAYVYTLDFLEKTFDSRGFIEELSNAPLTSINNPFKEIPQYYGDGVLYNLIDTTIGFIAFAEDCIKKYGYGLYLNRNEEDHIEKDGYFIFRR